MTTIARGWAGRGAFSRRAGGLVLTELVVIIAVAVIFVIILRPALSEDLEMKRRAECLSNLRKVGQAMSAYSADYGGFYPTAWRGSNPDDFKNRHLDYWGRSPASVLLIGGYAEEAGKLFRCPSFMPDPEIIYHEWLPVFKEGEWVRSTTGSSMTFWKSTYHMYSGYIHHAGGDPEIITEWEIGSPRANPFPHYKAAVKDTHGGRKVLGGDKVRGTWDVTPAPSSGYHLDQEGFLAGGNFVYNDGSASWTPFTGYNFDNLAHYWVPRNSGHTPDPPWTRMTYAYLPGPDLDHD